MDNDQLLQIYLQEYEKLKEEQTQRIGFRDGMIYTTLGAIGAILSFVITSKSEIHYYALLIVPWISVILGWTYLINDEKISSIGNYLRNHLIQKITKIVEQADTNIDNSSTNHNDDISTILGWEIFHRRDDKRRRRKIEQLIIDQITFVFSGLAALSYFCFVFYFVMKNENWIINCICGLEFILLIALAIEIWVYADFKRDS